MLIELAIEELIMR